MAHFKLAIAYVILALLCLVGGSAEIASVLYTDQAYTSFEDLALNGSVGAMMLASCQIRKNEFRKNLTRFPMYVEFRDRNHVCQDAWWKLGASVRVLPLLVLAELSEFVLMWYVYRFFSSWSSYST